MSGSASKPGIPYKTPGKYPPNCAKAAPWPIPRNPMLDTSKTDGPLQKIDTPDKAKAMNLVANVKK